MLTRVPKEKFLHESIARLDQGRRLSAQPLVQARAVTSFLLSTVRSCAAAAAAASRGNMLENRSSFLAKPLPLKTSTASFKRLSSIWLCGQQASVVTSTDWWGAHLPIITADSETTAFGHTGAHGHGQTTLKHAENSAICS